mgnify:CR=1 FL=1
MSNLKVMKDKGIVVYRSFNYIILDKIETMTAKYQGYRSGKYKLCINGHDIGYERELKEIEETIKEIVSLL